MANKGVQGRIVDENGAALTGLLIAAYDVEALFGDTLLKNTATQNDPIYPGLVKTANDGTFSISYPENAYGLEGKPDLVVRVYSSVKRLIYTSPVHNDVSNDILTLPPITIPRADAEGWEVTLGTGTPQYLSTGNKIEFLIDNEIGWSRLTQSIQNATTSIHVLQLIFLTPKKYEADPAKDIPVVISVFQPPMPATDGSEKPTQGLRLETELLKASQAPRNMNVRILVNKFRFFPLSVASDDSVKAYFEGAPPGHHVEVRFFKMPFTPMHAKVFIIDGTEAYLIGSPLQQDYYDSTRHQIDEPRRGRVPKATSGGIQAPIHDMNTLVTGPAVADLDKLFCLHWNEARPEGEAELAPAAPPPPQPNNAGIQVLRTLRGAGRFSALPHGETGIYEAYLRAFSTAQDFIYLENQYITSEEIAEALVLALKQNPQLQLIMLVNNKVDMPMYGKWQRKVFGRIMHEFSEVERENRIGFFTAWSHEAANPKSRLIRNYLHTKVGIVDNQWATAGSANLDGTGLTTNQTEPVLLNAPALLHDAIGLPLLPIIVFSLFAPYLLVLNLIDGFNVEEHRSSELNVSVFTAPGTANAMVDQMRRVLWAEHLGYRDNAGNPDPNHADLLTRPPAGWLKLWKDKARDKLAGLKANPTQVKTARIFEYPNDNGQFANLGDMDKYLKALGLQDSERARVEVIEKVKSFSFKEGKWD